jgi:hypothetical protein
VTAARAISLPWLLVGVLVLGAALGTGAYWLRASQEDARFEEVMDQTTRPAEPKRGRSVDVTAPPPAALEGIPPYPRAVPRRVAETMQGQGSQLAVAWFTTDDSVDQVLAFYEAAFAKLNVHHVSHRYNALQGYVGWLERDNPSEPSEDAGLEILAGVMHLVSAMKEGKQTAVLLSASRPMELLDNPTRLPPGVVLPPYADSGKVFDLGDGEMKQTTVWSEVRGRPLPEIEAWMRENLKQHGWKIADHASAPVRTALDFRRDKEHLSVVLTPSGAKVGLMVQYANQPQSLTEGL